MTVWQKVKSSRQLNGQQLPRVKERNLQQESNCAYRCEIILPGMTMVDIYYNFV